MARAKHRRKMAKGQGGMVRLCMNKIVRPSARMQQNIVKVRVGTVANSRRMEGREPIGNEQGCCQRNRGKGSD
jgi:hypothetical protein